ncbi:MAG: 3-dehydroquinate synthase [Spirochaetia bacterium]|nr:3-dehydroquinate synthase [Spirochaetia bacterium]
MNELLLKVDVQGSASGSYPIHITNSYANLGAKLREMSPKLIFISQKGLENVLDSFFKETGIAGGLLYLLEQGERNKHISRLADIYNWLIENRIDRKSVLVAIGGGVVGDFVGFVAATILRGVRFVQVPTTLLSAVDSSVGGKVAVNVDHGKNMVGAFYHPELVYCNVSMFQTLPDSEWACGFSEIVKHCCMEKTGKDLEFLESNIDQIRSPEILIQIVRDSAAFKASIVSEDPKELGLRSILNLGHTTAHALESITEYKQFSHGQAVSRGLVTALLLSLAKCGLSREFVERVLKLMAGLGLPMDTCGFEATDLFEHMKFDKKNTGDTIRFVLLEGQGKPVYGVPMSRDEFQTAWTQQKRRYG